MVIHGVKNDRGPKGKFETSFGQVLKIVENGWKLLKGIKMVKNGQKWSKKDKKGQK